MDAWEYIGGAQGTRRRRNKERSIDDCMTKARSFSYDYDQQYRSYPNNNDWATPYDYMDEKGGGGDIEHLDMGGLFSSHYMTIGDGLHFKPLRHTMSRLPRPAGRRARRRF